MCLLPENPFERRGFRVSSRDVLPRRAVSQPMERDRLALARTCSKREKCASSTAQVTNHNEAVYQHNAAQSKRKIRRKWLLHASIVYISKGGKKRIRQGFPLVLYNFLALRIIETVEITELSLSLSIFLIEKPRPVLNHARYQRQFDCRSRYIYSERYIPAAIEKKKRENRLCKLVQFACKKRN